MCVCNGGNFLDESINSILSQTYGDFDFLIIDDGSTDGSSEIIQKYKALDNRIAVITHDRPLGLGVSLNEGVLKATTQWIARMDADDVSINDRLQKQISYIENNNVDVIGGWAMDIDEDGCDIDVRRVPSSQSEIYKYVWTCPFIHPSVVFKRESILKVGSYPLIGRRQDYDLWFRCVAAGLKMANLPEVLIKYRQTGDYYKKNNWSVTWTKVLMGIKGCWRVKAGPTAYIGVLFPGLRMLVPLKHRKTFHNFSKRFDPRRK